MFLQKRLYTLLIFALFFSKTFAQRDSSDDKPFHFGFAIGFNAMDFNITPSEYKFDGKQYDIAVSALRPGFSVGIVSNLKLHRFWDFRFTPTLHFGERELVYRLNGETSTSSVIITSIPICLPFYLKYSAERYGNIRPYLIGGIGTYVDLGRNKEKPIYLRPVDVFFEIGMGCDTYFSFFKLAPEIKVAIGSRDVFTPLSERDAGMLSEHDKNYSLALDKLKSVMVTLVFNFE